MVEDPVDAMGEVGGFEGFGEVAVLLVIDEVWQAAGVEGDDGGSAGEGFGGGLGGDFLDAGDDHDVCGGVDEA